MPQLDQISAELDRLAAFEPTPFPVLSLYLDLRSNQHGRDQFDQFLRKELGARLRTFGTDAPERRSIEGDADRIRMFIQGVDRSANGVAVFASTGANLFE